MYGMLFFLGGVIVAIQKDSFFENPPYSLIKVFASMPFFFKISRIHELGTSPKLMMKEKLSDTLYYSSARSIPKYYLKYSQVTTPIFYIFKYYKKNFMIIAILNAILRVSVNLIMSCKEAIKLTCGKVGGSTDVSFRILWCHR
jgi:hypothetical protein